MTRKRICFQGWVQGVGFRFRAQQAAARFGCTGWVRNEWDGSVVMEIQGSEDAIDRVLRMIEQGTYVRIEGLDSRTIPLVEREYGFEAE